MRLLDRLRQRLKRSHVPVGPQQVRVSPTLARPDQSGDGFAVVDVETTGLDPGRDRVVEIAGIRTDAWGQIFGSPGMSVGHPERVLDRSWGR